MLPALSAAAMSSCRVVSLQIPGLVAPVVAVGLVIDLVRAWRSKTAWRDAAFWVSRTACTLGLVVHVLVAAAARNFYRPHALDLLVLELGPPIFAAAFLAADGLFFRHVSAKVREPASLGLKRGLRLAWIMAAVISLIAMSVNAQRLLLQDPAYEPYREMHGFPHQWTRMKYLSAAFLTLLLGFLLSGTARLVERLTGAPSRRFSRACYSLTLLAHAHLQTLGFGDVPPLPQVDEVFSVICATCVLAEQFVSVYPTQDELRQDSVVSQVKQAIDAVWGFLAIPTGLGATFLSYIMNSVRRESSGGRLCRPSEHSR